MPLLHPELQKIEAATNSLDALIFDEKTCGFDERIKLFLWGFIGGRRAFTADKKLRDSFLMPIVSLRELIDC